MAGKTNGSGALQRGRGQLGDSDKEQLIRGITSAPLAFRRKDTSQAAQSIMGFARGNALTPLEDRLAALRERTDQDQREGRNETILVSRDLESGLSSRVSSQSRDLNCSYCLALSKPPGIWYKGG